MGKLYNEWQQVMRKDEEGEGTLYDEWMSVMNKPKRPTPREEHYENVRTVARTGKKIAGKAVDIAGTATKPAQKLLFDYMQRGQFASAGAAEKLLEGKPKEMLSGAWEGLKGKEKSYIDLSKRFRKRIRPAEQETMFDEFVQDVVPGLVLDIALDPVTYIPAGMVTAPFKMIMKTKPAVSALKKMSKTKIAKLWNSAFRPSGGLDKSYYEMKMLSKYHFDHEQNKILKQIKSLTKGFSNHDLEEFSRIRSKLKTNPNALESLDQGTRNRLDLMGQMFEEAGRRDMEAGLIKEETFNKIKDWYLPGIYPGKTKLHWGSIPPSTYEKTKKPFFGKQKTYPTPLDAELAGKNPEMNIGYLLGARMRESLAYGVKNDFVNRVMDKFGKRYMKVEGKYPPIPEGYKLYFPKGQIRFFPTQSTNASKLKDLILNSEDDLFSISKIMQDEDAALMIDNLITEASSSIAGVTKKVPVYLLPEEIATDMNKATKFFDPDKITQFWLLRWHDRITNFWKGEATALRLPFHLRNMQTNWYMMWLAGAENLPLRIEQAAKVQMGKGSIKLGKKTYTAAELKDMTAEFGVRGRGWMGADIPDFFFRQLSEITKDGLTKKAFKNMNPMKWGRGVGTAVEDNARVGLFLDALAKGKTPEDASKLVRKYLFDYSELTDFEKNVMKRIFPFYTWTKKSAPLMFEQMVQQPAKFALVGKGHRTIDAVFTESEKEKKLRPEYYNDLFYQKIGSDKGGNPIYAHLDLPYMEINRLFNSAHWLSSVNPVTFKLLLETKYNVKTFPKVGLRIEDPPGKLVPAPAWIMFLPKKAKDVLGLQLMVNPDTKRRDIVGMTAKKRYAISVMFPMFEEWDKANPQPIKRYEKKAPWRTLSYWTGIKFDVNDLEMQRKYRLIEKYGLMNEARLLMHYTGKPPTAKEINEILSGKRKR